jgi:MoxR-like ATPase
MATATINEKDLEECRIIADKCREEAKKRLVGQDEVIDGIMTAFIAGGHVLLEGVPGLAKTLAIKTFSEISGLEFKRIQFTPDLLPADVSGTLIYEQAKGSFSVRKGPVFSNVVLADEINRAPAKVQSAMLEAMEERQVTIGEETYKLPDPFFVLATQNPIEQEGTYPLPEAQLDRFMFMLWLNYPSFEEEINILKSTTTGKSVQINKIFSKEEIILMQEIIRRIPVTDNVYEYAVKLVEKTRVSTPTAHPIAQKYLSWGAGPRASQYLIIGAKCHAALKGKYSPDIEDINAVAVSVLRHRIVQNYSSQAEGYTTEKIINDLINS